MDWKSFLLSRECDPYRLARPFIFMMDPEKAHHMTLELLKKGLHPRFKNDVHPSLRTHVAGLDFANPISLAAGFDKQAEVISEMFGFGFGSVELGSITPLSQPGNEQPRLFRLLESEAIINRFGFNSDGFDACQRRIYAWKDTHVGKRPGIVGINIGKNKESVDAVADYVLGVEKFSPCADYLTINISSPNTPGLRDLQGHEQLADLLQGVMAARDKALHKLPIFVKIAPDLTDKEQEEIAVTIMGSGANGIIISNTTTSRPETLPVGSGKEQGGLSGKPLFQLSTEVLSCVYAATGGQIPLIGCGGIASGEDAYKKIRAGASLVQLYTALIYHGPLIVWRISQELVDLLRRDGFASVNDAVGADHHL